MARLEGKVALVTGGGIGMATLRRCVREGAAVVDAGLLSACNRTGVPPVA